MAQISGSVDVPDMGRRQFMNFLAFGAVTGTALGGLYPYIKFFIPALKGSGGSGVTAKDAVGNDIKASAYLETHNAGDRSLAQGLKGDPTYVVIKDDNSIAEYGLNAICTHLGCVVPWNAGQNKFICPCHGSQYDYTGKVVRGPAPRSLALVHANVSEDDTLIFSQWTETDFRTDENPWWT